MEAATTASTERERSEQPPRRSPSRSSCGEIHEEMVFPWPQPDEAEQERVRGLNNAAARDRRAHRPARDRGEALDRRRPGRASSATPACAAYTCPSEYGGQGLSQTGYARVFETFAQIDATLSVVMGVHQSIGFKGIHMFGTDEQKERFLPDLARGRKLAGFALTEPNAGSDAYNIESRGGPAAGRLLGTERREALHRQRGHGLGLHHLRSLRDRRQGPPHRADPREADEGLRGRRAVRHDGAARQRPPPPVLQGRPGAAGERSRRARRGLPDRDADPQQRADRPRHRLGGSDQGPARPGDRTTSRSGASSAIRWRTSSSSRTRSAGWSPTCSASSRCAT